MRTALCAALAAAVSLVGCSGGGSTGPSAPVLTLSAGPGYDDVLVSWTTSGGSPDHFEIEGRIGDDPFEVVDAAIPGDAIGGMVTLEPGLPELIDVGARIRAVKGGKTSPWSAEAVYRRGPRPAADLRAFVQAYVGSDVTLTWRGESAVADGIAIDRGLDSGSGTVTGMQRIAVLGPGDVSFVDLSNAEAVSYRYRVIYLAGGRESTPAEASATAANPLPPADLHAERSGAGALLSWRNRSVSATELNVLRGDGFSFVPSESPVATLPATAASWVDAGPLAPGYHAWQVEARVGGSFSWSRTAFTGLLVPPALADLPLAATLIAAPEGTFYARRPSDGRLAAASSLGLAMETDSGFARVALDGEGPLAPGVVFDAAGAAHVVTLRERYWPDLPALTHRWYDGTAWRSEPVATTAVANVNGTWLATFTVTPTGAVHALFAAFRDGVAGWILRDATNAGGAFAAEDAWVSPWGWSPAAVLPSAIGDASGRVHVAFAPTSFQTVTVASRGAVGGWSAADLSLGNAFVGQLGLGVLGPDALALGVSGDVPGGSSFLEVRTLGPGGFSAPESLPAASRLLAFSASAGRVVLAALEPGGDADQVTLRARDALGWRSAVLGPTHAYAPATGVGVGGSGAVWALVRGGGWTAAGTDLASYAEQP